MSNTAPVEAMTLEELRVCVTQLRQALAAARAVAADLLQNGPPSPPPPIMVNLTPEQAVEFRELVSRHGLRGMTAAPPGWSLPSVAASPRPAEVRPISIADERYEINLAINAADERHAEPGNQNDNTHSFDFEFTAEPLSISPTPGCIMLELPL
jgi:hypothetical protein